jgi:hypothetical protein
VAEGIRLETWVGKPSLRGMLSDGLADPTCPRGNLGPSLRARGGSGSYALRRVVCRGGAWHASYVKSILGKTRGL